MRLLDIFSNRRQESREISELSLLSGRLRRFAGETEERRKAICQNAIRRALPDCPHAPNSRIMEAAWNLLQNILGYEGIFSATAATYRTERPTSETWEAISLATRQLSMFENREDAETVETALATLLQNIIPDYVPSATEESAHAFSAAVCTAAKPGHFN